MKLILAPGTKKVDECHSEEESHEHEKIEDLYKHELTEKYWCDDHEAKLDEVKRVERQRGGGSLAKEMNQDSDKEIQDDSKLSDNKVENKTAPHDPMVDIINEDTRQKL